MRELCVSYNTTKMKNKTLLIDGSNLMHRVYWVTSKTNTNTVHMFMNSIKKIYNDWMPTKIYIAWDSKLVRGEKSFRRENDDYKQNRDKSTWAKVYEHEETIKDVCESLGIYNIYPGVLEADDVIHFLAKSVKGEKVIITTDHDMLQLVDKNTCVYNPVRKMTYTDGNFEELTKVSMENYIHYKSLIGDKSDNIPGVPRVGHKTALRILDQGIEKSLSSEDFELYKNNLKLIDLSCAVNNHPGEEDIYEKQLCESYELMSDYNKFKNICETVGFPKKSVDNFTMFFNNEMNNILLQILK